MMQFPLTLAPLLERAGKLFSTVEIVSSRPDNSIHRYTYREMRRRARALAAALQALGLHRGDRVATLMWNHHVHLEAYFGVPCVGGVLHTLNLRLHPEELAHIINDAEDRWLIVDDVLVPLYERVRDKVCLQRVFVVPFSGHHVSHGYENYESLLNSSSGDPTYPNSTNMMLPPCATPRVLQESQKAPIPTAHWHFTPTPFRCPITFRFRAAIACCRLCPCFTPTPGDYRTQGS